MLKNAHLKQKTVYETNKNKLNHSGYYSLG